MNVIVTFAYVPVPVVVHASETPCPFTQTIVLFEPMYDILESVEVPALLFHPEPETLSPQVNGNPVISALPEAPVLFLLVHTAVAMP